MNAKARAQANEALEEAAQTLKRNQGAVRRALQLVRQAQAGLAGIEVETIHEDPVGGQGGYSEDARQAA